MAAATLRGHILDKPRIIIAASPAEAYNSLMDIAAQSLAAHKKLQGKISLSLKDTLESKEKLSLYYTPGVGAVSSYLAAHPNEVRDYTWTNNLVAVISDGSAVLGLGDIGPGAALPVMEGKAMLFKHFAGIDAVPIVLDVHTPQEIITAIKAIAPSFGAINLEDIAAPQCFAIEEQLKKDLDIPVMHDDQHGTAVVVLAGLINAMRVTGRQLSDCKIVLVGAGAAGVAIAKLLHLYAQPHIVAVDSRGIITATRHGLNPEKQFLAQLGPVQTEGSLHDALENADVVIGVSRGNMLQASDIAHMAKDPIVFALANPTPEIMPDVAKSAGAAIVATGRSDFANQVNNALAFPGIFRGALDHGVKTITNEHKIAAAEALANLVDNMDADTIIPTVFTPGLVSAVAAVIR